MATRVPRGMYLYWLQSSTSQSGLIEAMSLIVSAASVATTASPSRKARPLMARASCGQRPSLIAVNSSTAISSPSPRTITSMWGASASTCWYMKVAWMPPSTRTARGTVSAATSSTRSAA